MWQIDQPNPIGAFLQTRMAGQQMQNQQQQRTLDNEYRARQEQRVDQQTQQQRQQWLAENLPQAIAYADTPEKWDESVQFLEGLGFTEAGQYRGRFDLREALMAQVQGGATRNAPASVLEHQYFQNLPEDQQQVFMNLQRSGNLVDIGGVPHYRNASGQMVPLSSLQNEAQGAYTLAEAKSSGAVQTGMERGPDGVVRPQPGAPLPAGTEDRIVEFTAAAQAARANAANYTQLADEMIAQMPQSGVAAEWADAFRTVTGTENAESLLRRRWAELRVGNAIQNLPPGVASDKDIELVMSAFLPTFAEPETVASFLRGLAKVEEIEAQYQEFRAQWMSNNGTARGMDEAWRQQLEAQSGGQSGGSQGDNDPLGLRGR